MTLKVVNHWVAVGSARIIFNRGNLNDFLAGQLEQDLTDSFDTLEHSLVLEADQALETESQSLAKQVDVRFVKMEPFLRSQDSDIFGCGQSYLHWSFRLSLEGILVVGIRTTVQELTGDLHNWLSFPSNGASYFNHLS